MRVACLQVIEGLRGRLKDRVEEAFGTRDPASVCQHMIAVGGGWP